MDRDSIENVANFYRRDGSGIESRSATKFFSPIQTVLGGPSSPLYNGYRVFYPAVKRPEHGVNHSVPLFPLWPVLGWTLPLILDNIDIRCDARIHAKRVIYGRLYHLHIRGKIEFVYFVCSFHLKQIFLMLQVLRRKSFSPFRFTPMPRSCWVRSLLQTLSIVCMVSAS